MTRIVLLARHGSHDELGRVLSGRSGIGLNRDGERDADRLADRLADVPLTRIYTSPQRRARQTASAVADRLGIEVTIADALDEIDFGSWTGQRFAALAGDDAWAEWNMHRGSAVTPGGEDMAAVTRRVTRFVEALDDEGSVLCVSHCDVIRGLVAHYLELDGDRLLAFDCDPGSLTTLALYDGGGRVVTVNERPV